MCRIVHNQPAWTICVGILITCSTGCVLEPGHGQVIPSVDSEIEFLGAVLESGARVAIQAHHPEYGWETLVVTAADMPYLITTGTGTYGCAVSGFPSSTGRRHRRCTAGVVRLDCAR